MATYVLVHGGAHGGWCYQRVAGLLRSAGHDVYTPTMTVYITSAPVSPTSELRPATVGCTVRKPHLIRVREPVITLDPLPTRVVEGTSVNVSLSGDVGLFDQFVFDFGDGTIVTRTQSSASHTQSTVVCVVNDVKPPLPIVVAIPLVTRVMPKVPLTIASSSEMTMVSAIRASTRRGSARPVAEARSIESATGASARPISGQFWPSAGAGARCR